jgi:hypothetical protein
LLVTSGCELCTYTFYVSSSQIFFTLAYNVLVRYNSAVFQSLASNDYAVAVVTPVFLTGGEWNITAAEDRGSPPLTIAGATSWVADNRPGYAWSAGWTIPGITPENAMQEIQQNASKSGLYLKMNVSDCYAGYADYWSELGNVVIVTKNESVKAQVNDSLLIFASVIPRYDNWAKNSWAQQTTPTIAGVIEEGPFQGPHDGVTVDSWYLGPENYDVDYCLVQPAATSDERCRFEYSPEIMIAVCVINLVKTLVIFATWFLYVYQWKKQTAPQQEVLYTLGDAISSFMKNEDPTTQNMCLATKDDFVIKRTWKGHLVREQPSLSEESRPWEYRETYWWRAASVQRWFWLIVL